MAHFFAVESGVTTTLITVVGGGIVAVMVAILQTKARKREVESTSGQAAAIIALAEELERSQAEIVRKDGRIAQLEQQLESSGITPVRAKRARRRHRAEEDES